MSAADRGWGPGWPDCQRGRIVPLSVEGVSFPGGVRKEVHPLFRALAQEFHDKVEPLVKGWCWGFACRAIGGTTRPSNHSWGLALDFNAPNHPWGATNTFSSAQQNTIRALAKKYGMRWGGDYSGKKDDMHFEYMGTPAEAAALVKKLGLIGTEEDDVFCKHGDENEKVRALQYLIMEAGGSLPKYGADADYGDETANGLKALIGGDGRTYGPKQYAALMAKLGGEGARGPKGDPGEKGDRGPRGPRGPAGPKPVLSIDVDYE